VRITLRGYVYRTTVASMGGRFMVPLSAEHRAAAGVTAGEQVDVDIELDTAPREVVVPADLDDALNQDSAVRAFYDALSYTHRKEWVRWVEEAKKAETRGSRIGKAVTALSAGQRTR
ncbi:MAG: YdeI/OmpD-associated family protein, partial [Mycobacteriaceae bacterium]